MTLGREQDTAGVSTRSRQDRGRLEARSSRFEVFGTSSRAFLACHALHAPGLGLDHFPEVVDCTTEGIFQLYLRLPFQDSTRPTDIGTSDLGIIGGQRMVGDGAC